MVGAVIPFALAHDRATGVVHSNVIQSNTVLMSQSVVYICTKKLLLIKHFDNFQHTKPNK